MRSLPLCIVFAPILLLQTGCLSDRESYDRGYLAGKQAKVEAEEAERIFKAGLLWALAAAAVTAVFGGALWMLYIVIADEIKRFREKREEKLRLESKLNALSVKMDDMREKVFIMRYCSQQHLNSALSDLNSLAEDFLINKVIPDKTQQDYNVLLKAIQTAHVAMQKAIDDRGADYKIMTEISRFIDREIDFSKHPLSLYSRFDTTDAKIVNRRINAIVEIYQKNVEKIETMGLPEEVKKELTNRMIFLLTIHGEELSINLDVTHSRNSRLLG